MEWNGEERRSGTMSFCNQHIDTIKILTKVSTSMESLERTMSESSNFKKSVLISFIGIIMTMFIQFGGVCYIYGQMSKQITVNTTRLDVIEQTARELIKSTIYGK